MMAEGMHSLKLPVVLAAFICVLANAQCVVSCASAPCTQPATSSANLPPCHRHSSKVPAPKPCTVPVVVADVRLHTAPAIEVRKLTAILDAYQPAASLVWLPVRLADTASPPPESSGPAFRILRI